MEGVGRGGRATGGAGGGWTCRCTDTRTRECSLNVSVTSRCHDASCRDVVPTFKSAGQQRQKRETEMTKTAGIDEEDEQKEQKDGYRKKD